MKRKKMTNPDGLRHRISNWLPDAFFMDGYDDCIEGIMHRFGNEGCVIYNSIKVMEKLQRVHKMTPDEAVEYHEYNQLGAWVGETTPAFFTPKEHIN